MIPVLPWDGETGVLAPDSKGEEMAKWKPKCPRCGSVLAYRDGSAGNGKQRYRCKVCGKSYIGHRDGVRDLVRELATGLLREGVPVPVIHRAISRHCSRRWLYNLRSSVLNG